MDGYSKYQYSQFDKLDGQYVVRTDDAEEFKTLVKSVHLAVGSAPETSQRSNSAPASDKAKVPYKHIGDVCETCNSGILRLATSKAGKPYLKCDKEGCDGYAWKSDYPKKFAATGAMPVPNDDLPF